MNKIDALMVYLKSHNKIVDSFRIINIILKLKTVYY